MTKRAFRFSKEHGVLSNRQDIHSTLDMWLNSISNGNYVMTVERVQKPRSNPQNAYMWVCFTIIAQAWSEATGYVLTPQNVHDTYCLMFLPVTMPNGQNIPGNTSKLSVEEFTDFLNKVQADAATEYGIQLPSPDEARFYQFAQDYGYGA